VHEGKTTLNPEISVSLEKSNGYTYNMYKLEHGYAYIRLYGALPQNSVFKMVYDTSRTLAQGMDIVGVVQISITLL
jgi:hypothetical protein